MKKTALFLAFIAGLTAMGSQIIIIREFLSVFSGDELSIGLVLCSWLAGGALGSIALWNIARRVNPGTAAIWLCQIFLSLYLPLSVFLVRYIRVILGANAGQILPFYILAIASFILLLPICATLGVLFPLLCRIYKQGAENVPEGIAGVYAFESFGSMTGGLAASFFLVRLANSFQAIIILSMLNILSGFLLAIYFKRYRLVSFFVNIILLIAVLFLSLGGAWGRLDNYSIQRQWKGFELLKSKNTIYANLTAFKRGSGQISFFADGMLLYAVPDKQFSEEAVNFCLLEHKSPQNILLIGGGVGGLLTGILKHPVKSVVYLELDPALVDMARSLLPEEYRTSLSDERVTIINTDGRLFVKNTSGKYDCVILCLGEPYNALINRFYTHDFFMQLKRALNPGGVFSFGINASENYINPESAAYLRSLFLTLKGVFPEVKAIPGETIRFLASDTKGALTYDYNLLMARAKERGLALEYVREYYLSSRMSPDKIKYLEGLLLEDKDTMANFDLRPSAYYYGIISWSSRFGGSLFTKLLKALNMGTILYGSGLILLALFIFCKRRPDRPLLAALGAGGLSQSAFQMIFIFSFQVLYGYIFHKLGLLFASFMLGLFISGWWYSKSRFSPEEARRRMLLAQAGVVLFSVSIPAILYGVLKTRSSLAADLGANTVFPALSLFAGLLEGYIFSSINQVYLAAVKDKGGTGIAGLTYGWDLIGACLGAVLCGVLLIPVAGITTACLLIAALNLSIFCLLIRGHRKHHKP